ncbi:hypothetical protein GCM10007392_45500 [Saccharospirillum salsuginis]|uniref:Uncharacterized protein n=1 Tax=Saccharospirillum salsuginis TaxID=418750 RepID=A0A918KRB7_9GAMM|nr:hypothetical protein GCM10007392_45500 [Saccharospirillum salsuginis]
MGHEVTIESEGSGARHYKGGRGYDQDEELDSGRLAGGRAVHFDSYVSEFELAVRQWPAPAAGDTPVGSAYIHPWSLDRSIPAADYPTGVSPASAASQSGELRNLSSNIPTRGDS